MDALRLPLRLERSGTVERGNRVDAILALIGTMFVTSESLWPEASWFGLLEVVERLNSELTQQEALRDAINRALQELAIDWVSVRSVSLGTPTGNGGVRPFTLALDMHEGEVVTRQLPM